MERVTHLEDLPSYFWNLLTFANSVCLHLCAGVTLMPLCGPRNTCTGGRALCFPGPQLLQSTQPPTTSPAQSPSHSGAFGPRSVPDCAQGGAATCLGARQVPAGRGCCLCCTGNYEGGKEGMGITADSKQGHPREMRMMGP